MTAKRLTILFSLLLMAMVLAAGCKRTVPVQNITDNPVPMSEKASSLSKVKKAITVACAEQGWVIQGDKKNVIRAKLILRSHEAVVDIPYTAKKFSIIYVSSSDLAYENGNIHVRYNSWVKNLAKAIELELSRNG